MAAIALWAVVAATSTLITPQRAPFGMRSAALKSLGIQANLLAPDRPPTPDELRRAKRMQIIAERYPDADLQERTNIAASSLPEEENGGWADVAACTLRNAAVVGALLAAVSALPGASTAADFATGLPAEPLLPTARLLADSEEADVIAIIAVPLLVGGLLVGLAASQYNNLIDKLNGDR